MARIWIIFILLVALAVWGVFYLVKKRKVGSISSVPRFAAKSPAGEIWAQLYETSSLDEARSIRAQLTEAELDCLIYEQGKRDSQGNIPKGFGVAVPKSHLSRAQTILTRILS